MTATIGDGSMTIPSDDSYLPHVRIPTGRTSTSFMAGVLVRYSPDGEWAICHPVNKPHDLRWVRTNVYLEANE